MADAPLRYWSARRKSGPTRAGLERVVADRTGLDAVLLELARSTADLVDFAKRAQDVKLWMTSSQRLVQLMGQLGVSGDRGDVAAPSPAEDVSPLAGVVGGAPEVRDPAEP